MDLIENKVEKSGLITIDLGDFYPKGIFQSFDITQFLFEGIILKERDFREALKNHDWNLYKDSFVFIEKAEDLIIPSWAYMLISSYLTGNCNDYYYGSKAEFINYLILDNINANVIPEEYMDKRVLVKGCSKHEIPQTAYVEIFKVLKPVTKSIMFGEACSSVPVYKRPN